MQRVKTEHELLAEAFAGLRTRLVACREAAQSRGNGADALSKAMATHLADLVVAALPAAAQVIWTERIARPLKADTSKPMPAKAYAAIRSWPSARAALLAAALAEIEVSVEEALNDAEHEVIYAEISRTYS